jgi:hypothetical protein
MQRPLLPLPREAVPIVSFASNYVLAHRHVVDTCGAAAADVRAWCDEVLVVQANHQMAKTQVRLLRVHSLDVVLPPLSCVGSSFSRCVASSVVLR